MFVGSRRRTPCYGILMKFLVTNRMNYVKKIKLFEKNFNNPNNFIYLERLLILCSNIHQNVPIKD
jgi:hypothetical protein